MTNTERVRIGIVESGTYTRAKHIPGFRTIDEVEIVGVCNRTPESTRRAAAELSIPKAYENWHELVEDDEIDAILIGVPPEYSVLTLLTGTYDSKIGSYATPKSYP